MRFGGPEWPDERLRVFRIGFPIVRRIALALAPMRVEDRERIPAEGPYIVVANHISWMDPPWSEFAFDRAIRWMAKSEAFEVPIVGALLRVIGSFPVRRGESDRRAVVTALRVLQAGLPLGFFPEGHRSEAGTMLRAHPGVGLLATRSGATLVPVGVSGTPRARLGRFWRRDVVLRIGEPFRARDLGVGDEPQAVADAIMRRVAALIPAEMRGEYRLD